MAPLIQTLTTNHSRRRNNNRTLSRTVTKATDTCLLTQDSLAPKFPPPQAFDAIPDITSSYQNTYSIVTSSPQQQHHQYSNNNPQTQSHLQRHANTQNYFLTPSHPVSAYPGIHHGGPPGPYGLHRPPLPGYNSHNGIHPPPGGMARMHNGMMSASPTGSNNTSSPGRESGSEESSSDDSVQVSRNS